ncbi:hypothetical protein [Rubellimicrobium roseum]|uniref:Uncharacterized protein n=1 Tax=Rubellimicrobium roseum TaxID=687525 RepID=A0A5C4NJD9_9RHOB|nr:hypothetical protein [Rubellimicrobium roseum]TNC74921.1 hypothetical protein FHG71_01985 [Rubellimicrobium roseum]
MAVIADAPPRRDLSAALDRLPVSADAKALLHDLAKVTFTIGRQVLAIGRKIVAFALSLAKTFPNTIFGIILGVVVTMLVGSIPLVGALLASMVGPLLLAFGITMGAINDMRSGAIGACVAELQDALRGLPRTV